MIYYKVIQNNKFVGIGTTDDLRVYQSKHDILLVADEDIAQYIQIKDILYRDNWFKSITNYNIQYETAEISVITEEEYQQLFEAIDKGEEIQIAIEEDTHIQSEPEQTPIEETVTIEFLKEQKIKEMNYICNQIITNGFDITLSDDNKHHFSLKIQDQLNFIALSTMIQSGETIIPYHADNELCRYYSAEDIGKVIKFATEFKTYHTTYYNSLKAYIQSIQNKEVLRTITYGIDIPTEYQSDILKVILANAEGKDEIFC